MNVWQEFTNAAEEARTTAAEHLSPPWTFNGLASLPQVLRRGWFGNTTVVVPPGATAVLHGPQGLQRVLTAGSYSLWDLPRGQVLVQWINTARQRRTIGPIEGWSADKWRVRVAVAVDFVVADPVSIAAHAQPLDALADAVHTATLYQLERLSHAALTGLDGEQTGGIEALAQALVQRLTADPALHGLEIIQVQVLERLGDERRIEVATETAVSIAHLEEAARLSAAEDLTTVRQLQGQQYRMAAEHDVRMAALVADGREHLARHELDAQRHTLAAQLRVLEASIDGQIAQFAHAEQQWQAEQQRLHAQWQVLLEQQHTCHETDQQVRLLEAQHAIEDVLAQRALASEERRHEHERELGAMQQRHEQMLLHQRQHLEHWRAQHTQHMLAMQQQHTQQLALINGTTAIATEAVGHPAAPMLGYPDPLTAESIAIAGEGLRTLMRLQDSRPTAAEPPEEDAHVVDLD